MSTENLVNEKNGREYNMDENTVVELDELGDLLVEDDCWGGEDVAVPVEKYDTLVIKSTLIDLLLTAHQMSDKKYLVSPMLDVMIEAYGEEDDEDEDE